jgi:hypothetical protein
MDRTPKSTLTLVMAVVLTSCVGAQMAREAKASLPVYAPIRAENWRIMPLANARTFVRDALRDWSLDVPVHGLRQITDAKADSSGITIIDSTAHTTDVPLKNVPIYVSFDDASATLKIGDHIFKSSNHISAQKARLLADAINVLQLYGTEGAEIKINEFSDPEFIPPN